jgi:hypothetical protein
MLIKRKMKKLNLEKLKLATEDVLQQSQLASIYGGSSGSDCSNNICTVLSCCSSQDWCVQGYCEKRP